MYKTILVDDDLPVLEFLSSAVNWSKLGFELAGAYSNPLDALAAAKLHKPDVLITDIGMPEMNGIDLIRALRALQPRMKCVILSCHDDFSFAQQAVKLQVSEYVLKETMNAKAVSELLARLREALDGETGFRQKEKELELQMRVNRSDLKRAFIRKTLEAPMLDKAEWQRQALEYGMDFGKSAYLPVLGFPSRLREAMKRFQTRDLLLYTAENIAEELLDTSEGAVFSSETGEIILLFPYYSQLHINSRQKVEDTLRKLQQCLEQYAKAPFSFIIGTPAEDGGRLREILGRGIAAAESRFYWPPGSILRLEHITGGFGSGDMLLAEYMTALEEFRRAVLEEQPEQVEAFIRKWLAFIQFHRFSPVEVKEWLLKMILDIRMRLKSLQHYQSSYDSEVLHHDVMELTSLEELEGWLRAYMLQAMEWAEQVYHDSKNREILECQRFVAIHWNERITLEDAARHLHLHPNYLSRLFKRETGENFVEFVTRLKMEKAKELLELTDKSVEDISLLLAYDNKNYFTKLFKAHTGLLPSAYRLQKQS